MPDAATDWILPLLACPRCTADLHGLERCAACGCAFGEENGVPSLMPDGAERLVTYRFNPARSVVNDAFRQAFRYPPVSGSIGKDGPYHLDRAHAAVLDTLPAGARVLEIGCDGGQMRAYLRAKGLDYVGTDISAARVADVLRRHGGPDLLCDIHFAPFRDRSFDLVYSAAVTEHLASPYLAVQEVFRILKPGGRYLGNVSFLEPWHDDSFFHMSPLGAHELLVQAGFEVEHVWPGRGYSGFRALAGMGNKVTRRLRYVGDAMFLAYNAGNYLRDRIRPGKRDGGITDAARVGGATDWIARKPVDA